jgi:hypothetical protein
MNWGYKILSIYAIFIVGIMFMVFKSSSQNQDLVTSDYYEQELKYQDRIDDTQRANALSADVKYAIQNHELNIILPSEMKNTKIDAEVLLYCTADQTKDIRKSFSTENGAISFAVPASNKGLHELQLTWKANGTSYFYKHKIMIP